MTTTCIALWFSLKEWVFLDTFPFARIASTALRAHVLLGPVASLALHVFSVCNFFLCAVQCFVKREADLDMHIFAVKFNPFTLFLWASISERVKVKAFIGFWLWRSIALTWLSWLSCSILEVGEELLEIGLLLFLLSCLLLSQEPLSSAFLNPLNSLSLF